MAESRQLTDRDDLYRRWFSPEWMVKFAPFLAEDAPVLTIKDCALALALVGRYSSRNVDPDYSDHVRSALYIAGKDPAPPSWARMEIPKLALRRECGIAQNRDLDNHMMRLINMGSIVGSKVFRDIEDLGAKVRVEINGDTLKAHPLNSRTRQAVSVDVRALSRFRSLQSVGAATRLTAWLRSDVREGLPRGRYEMRRGKATFRFAAEDVAETFGFVPAERGTIGSDSPAKAAKRGWHPHLLKPDVIADDLATIGYRTDWTWLKEGRTPVALQVEAEVVGHSPMANAIEGKHRTQIWREDHARVKARREGYEG